MDTGDKAIIFYITDNGLSLAQRLNGLYPHAETIRFRSEELTRIWHSTKKIIFIMAAGIVVRTIAPLIKDKKTDPAVVVLDEKGTFVISLLSGHIGGANRLARELADYLNAEAVITTASGLDNLSSKDLWAKDNNLIIGIGCNSRTSADEIEDAVKKTLNKNNLLFSSIHSIATIDKKGKEPGLVTFAQSYGFEINTFTPEELNTVDGISKSEAVFKATGANAVAEPATLLSAGTRTLLIPKTKIRNVTIAVAEIKTEHRAQNTEQRTKNKEQRTRNAVASFSSANSPECGGNPPRREYRQSINQGKNLKSKIQNLKSKINSSLKGKIYLVGTGPGTIEHITPYARNALRRSDVIVGYSTYLDLIKDLIKDKELVSSGMTQEIDRCKRAVEIALSGRTVAVVSSGDPGIYAMAGLVFEILKAEAEKIRTSQLLNFSTSFPTVEVIPGIPALNACASRLGAPLMHDFASISLSDRLTPWDLIEKRLEAAAASDFVIVLYNPRSKGRLGHINKALEIISRHRLPETPVGIVKGAMRENERIVITDLKNMLDYDIDMQTTVIIGNSKTFSWNNLMITPRGYEIREAEKLGS